MKARKLVSTKVCCKAYLPKSIQINWSRVLSQICVEQEFDGDISEAQIAAKTDALRIENGFLMIPIDETEKEEDEV